MATWVIDFISAAGYLGILLLMFAENVFPPIPSEVIMPLAGYLASQGKLTFAGIVAAGIGGSVLGALPFYYLGRKLGDERLKTFADAHGRWLTVSRQDLENARQWFESHGRATVFFCRLVPGIRSLISIPAGIARMELLPFLTYTAAGSALWSGALAYLGYWLGRNFVRVSEYLAPVSWVVFGVIAAIYVVRVIRHR